MVNSNQIIQIKDIILLTLKNEIILSGTYYRDWMNYETQINIDSTQLNKVINQLQKNNPEVEVSELFSSCASETGHPMFYFNANSLDNAQIEVITFAQQQDLKLIRA